jgi:hypothetical protein
MSFTTTKVSPTKANLKCKGKAAPLNSPSQESLSSQESAVSPLGTKKPFAQLPSKQSRSVCTLPDPPQLHYRELLAFVVDACGHVQSRPFDHERGCKFLLTAIQNAVDKIVVSPHCIKVSCKDQIFKNVSFFVLMSIKLHAYACHPP